VKTSPSEVVSAVSARIRARSRHRPPAPLRNKFFLREVLLRKTLAAALSPIIASLAVIPVKASALVAEIADVFDVLYLSWR